MDANTIRDDAKFELHAAIRSSHVVTATTMPRIHLATLRIVMNLLDAMLSKLYVLSVILNRRLPRCVLSVASTWENIIARFADSMMIWIKDNIIVMNVAFAGLVVVTISFTVRDAALAIQ